VGATRYANVPIRGDGTGAECTIVTTNDQRIDSITITNQGSGYTFANVDLVAGNVPTGTTRPTFDVIISPTGGHGADIYRELGATNVLLYSRIENDIENSKNPSPKMRYCYQGTAFRYQPNGQGKPEEFTQAGFEIIGGADTDESRLGDEIEIMRLAVDAIRQVGIKDYEIRLNELNLFDRFITALDPAPRIQRRLKRSFKHQQNLQTTLETLAIDTNDNQPNYLQGAGLQDANLQNADLVGANFIGASIMGERDMTEIKARIKQKQKPQSAQLEQAQIEAIKAYSSIECKIENMTNVFADLGLAVSKQFKEDVRTLQARLMMIAKEADINPQAIIFSSQYGRKLAYYTGLAFEIYATNQRTNTDKLARRAIAGGGRYDDLIDSLQTGKMAGDIISAPAIGAAIAVERLDAARPYAEC